jgi:glycosyltransferase involved in cell wall biosynthesis
MIAYQVTAALIGLSIGGLILWLVRKNHLHGPYATWWIAAAIGAIFLGFFSEIVNPVARILGVFYPPLLGIILVMGAVLFKLLYNDIDRTRREFLIRALSQRVVELERRALNSRGIPNSSYIFEKFRNERILHIGKGLPSSPGGIEKYVGDLLEVSKRLGSIMGAVVHKNHAKLFGNPPFHEVINENVFVASSYGSLLYAPLSPFFSRVLNRAIDTFRPTVLHIHLPNTSAFFCLFSRRARRIPWTVHWHADVDPWALDWRMQLLYPLYRPFEQAILRRARSVIATSQHYLESSEPLARWRYKCEVIPLGLDSQRLDSVPPAKRIQLASLWKPGFPIRLLAVGRLTYYKGFNVLLEAMAKTPSAQLIIVGAGAEYARLKRQVAWLGLEERVSLVGYRDDEFVHTMMQTASALCVPSLDRSEAFGIVALEAMIYKCPVVASDIPGSGLGWVVSHCSTSKLVLPNDSFSLAAALDSLWAEGGDARQTTSSDSQHRSFESESEISRFILDSSRVSVGSEAKAFRAVVE